MRLASVTFLAGVLVATSVAHDSGEHSGPPALPHYAQENGEPEANDHHAMMADDASHSMTGHDNGMMEMAPSPASMAHQHGRPILNDPNLEPQQRKYWEMYNTTTYFSSDVGGSHNKLYLHSALTVAAWGFLYPLSVFLSSDARAQWVYIPVQTLQSITAVLALILLALYSVSAPDLYPNNLYAKVSWVMLALVVTHWTAMITRAIAGYLDGANGEPLPQYVELNSLERQSADSTHARHGESSTDFDSDEDGLQPESDAYDLATDPEGAYKRFQPRQSRLLRKIANNAVFAKLTKLIGGCADILFQILNIPLFFIGMYYLLLGIATGFLMGKGHNVFALLAHFIKGGVFFLLGFFELARYFGAFSRFGMAWNSVTVPTKLTEEPSRWRYLKFWPQNATMEFWQSAAILFYGSTNIFLEHLGNSDGVWNHKDLQHASIAFMFIGGGLCGTILECKSVRRAMASSFGFENGSESSVQTFSLNPMPAFTVFWTGVLMSRHQQETELSTQIHVQWGAMLSLAAVLRLITLMMLTLRSRNRTDSVSIGPHSFGPQKPFTELLVSFCLICGGLIFMFSNRETVEAMIYRGIDSMFTLNVSVGITTLFMSYAILIMVARGLAVRS